MLSRVAAICAFEAEGLLRDRRRFWVHPYNETRGGRFQRFYEEIRSHEDKFQNYYRMSIKSFDELLSILTPQLRKESTFFRDPISPEERLTVTLRYLSTGSTFASLLHEFKLGRSTIGGIVQETCQVIWFGLKDLEMSQPSVEDWCGIADQFYSKTDFPNCVGAVDGKHIRCINPRNSGSKFFNYKKFFSIVLMAVADSYLRFIAIDVGAYGQEGDSTVFRDCSLGKKLYSQQLNLPPPRCLPNTECDPMPFVMVADEAFKLHTNLLRPFPQRNLDYCKRIYNFRHTRARRTVECAFGLLANKWRVFHTPILVSPDFAEEIVKACCILHNFVRKRDGVNFDEGDDDLTHPFIEVENIGSAPRDQGVETRSFFANYFVGAGAIPYQDDYI